MWVLGVNVQLPSDILAYLVSPGINAISCYVRLALKMIKIKLSIVKQAPALYPAIS